ANTAIIIPSDWSASLFTPNSLGIFLGLFFGKSIGITLFAFIAVISGLAIIPKEFKYKNIVGVAFLGGIGFTMSTFITLLAFTDEAIVVSSKISILISSFIAGLTGYIILKLTLKEPKQFQET
ncbi:MAG: Na+/H+ antiporter NhaA, partial [Candidatus Kapabacteria bacterium]|nr:Na+/H+ antiporter NhaA [Candidatus Kapabacteria bacterium]